MQPIATELDHVVIVAADLAKGVEFCEQAFGVKLLKGGEHDRVGTHNFLLNLGEGIYLEVIAINPNAKPADCPRWFGMDWSEQRARALAGPYLATYVARTNDINRAADSLPAVGKVRRMRRGPLEWQITIRDDGALVENGTVPPLIQWPHGIHPTRNMPESPCRLLQLAAYHPAPDALRAAWSALGLHEDDHLSIQKAEGVFPYMLARLSTPNGIVELR